MPTVASTVASTTTTEKPTSAERTTAIPTTTTSTTTTMPTTTPAVTTPEAVVEATSSDPITNKPPLHIDGVSKATDAPPMRVSTAGNYAFYSHSMQGFLWSVG